MTLVPICLVIHYSVLSLIVVYSRVSIPWKKSRENMKWCMPLSMFLVGLFACKKNGGGI